MIDECGWIQPFMTKTVEAWEVDERYQTVELFRDCSVTAEDQVHG